MAQNLQPGRSDNRGGNKPKTSTKKLFIYRVERSKHEELKAYAIKLNEEVERENLKRYTITMRRHPHYSEFDLNLILTLQEAQNEMKRLQGVHGKGSSFKIEEIENIPYPCNTTEK
jgi:hypothetical protein